MDRNKIPYRFLKNWESYRCWGRTVTGVSIYDRPSFERMLPRKYGIIVDFGFGLKIKLDPFFSEADAKWTLRKKLEEKLGEIDDRRVSVKRVPYTGASRINLMEEMIRKELKKVKLYDLNYEDDDWDDDPQNDLKIQLERDFESIINENKKEVRDGIPEEMQRFADILDED